MPCVSSQRELVGAREYRQAAMRPEEVRLCSANLFIQVHLQRRVEVDAKSSLLQSVSTLIFVLHICKHLGGSDAIYGAMPLSCDTNELHRDDTLSPTALIAFCSSSDPVTPQLPLTQTRPLSLHVVEHDTPSAEATGNVAEFARWPFAMHSATAAMRDGRSPGSGPRPPCLRGLCLFKELEGASQERRCGRFKLYE